MAIPGKLPSLVRPALLGPSGEPGAATFAPSAALDAPLDTVAVRKPRAVAEEDPVRPLIIAHRGASHDAPENTLAAFRLAFQKHDADGIEFDVRLTQDGKVVVFHDEDTSRLAPQKLTVRESTLAQLQQLDIGQHEGIIQRIPELKDVLALVPAHKKAFVELKEDMLNDKALAQAVAAELERNDPRIFASAFDGGTLAAFHQAAPEFPTALLFEAQATQGEHTLRPEDAASMADASHAQALSPHYQIVLDGVPRNWGDRPVNVWTVDSPEAMQALAKKGVASIITNEPGMAREALGRGPAPVNSDWLTAGIEER